MHIQAAIIALLGLVGSAYACYSCSSPCYWCGGGYNGGGYNGGGYFPTYQPSFPYYGGGGGGGAASAAASASASGGGFGGGYPYGGGGGASAAAAAAAAAGGGASASSAAAAASGGGGGGGGYYRPQYFQQPYWGNQYWDVSSDAAQQVKDKKSACAVLIEQYVDEPVLANDLIRVVNETFFSQAHAKKIQSDRHKKTNFTLDATPSTFHCCHVLYGNELLKKDGLINDSLVEQNTTNIRQPNIHETEQRRVRAVKNVLQAKSSLRNGKQQFPPQIYALPILPPKVTCASLTDALFEGLQKQLKGDEAVTTTTVAAVLRSNQNNHAKKNNNKHA